jgi:hypothetical protein
MIVGGLPTLMAGAEQGSRRKRQTPHLQRRSRTAHSV